MPQNRIAYHWPVLLVVLGYLLLASIFTTLIPLGEAPDEAAHVRYADFIAEYGHLPHTLEERREADYKAVWPPLYHALIAGPLAYVGDAPPQRLKSVGDTPRRLIPTNGQTIAAFLHTADELWPWHGLPLAWHLGRVISVGLSALTLIVTYAIAWSLTHRRDIALGVAALQATLPQFVFIGSVINDDNLLFLLSGLVLLSLIRCPTPPKLWHLVGIGALVGLATVAKYNALPLYGIVAAWILWMAPWRRWLSLGLAFTLGATVTGGWWFGFVLWHFNQIESQGLLSGILAALSAGAADASLRQVAAGSVSFAFPPPGDWLTWVVTLFQSWVGLFGGGSTIRLPLWIYGVLAIVYLAAGYEAAHSKIRLTRPVYLWVPLFFLPLPLVRFLLSGLITETAQGRHLFPALSILLLGVVLGLHRYSLYVVGSVIAGQLVLCLYSIWLIVSSYPPPLPVHTTDITVENRRNLPLTDSITLRDFDIEPPHVTLIWQAEDIPPQDYLIELTVTDAEGQAVSGWLGHPVGGRYPTRAWDDGDIIIDTIPLYLPPTSDEITLILLDATQQPMTPAVTLTDELSPPFPRLTSAPRLRADGLPPDDAFSYRSTVSVVSQEVAPLRLGNRGFTPTRVITSNNYTLQHFIVAADWPSGTYRHGDTEIRIANRPRQFQPPPVQYPLAANFGDRLTIVGYDLPQRIVQPGESFPVTLHLRAERTMGDSYLIFNHLLDADFVQRGGEDRIPLRYYNTLLWVPGEIVSDSYLVPVDADAPPGVYWLDVGLYPTDHPERTLPLVVDGVAQDQTGVKLGPVKVGGPPPGVTVAEATPDNPVNITLGDIITLPGFDWHDETLTLYWKTRAAPPADYTVFIHLLDESGQLAAQFDGPPTAGSYPTSLWEPGEIIIDTRLLAGLSPGRYRVLAGLYHPDTGERLTVPGRPGGTIELFSMEVNQ